MYTPGKWLSVDRTLAVTAPFTCGSSSRSSVGYVKTVEQFGLDHHPRYTPGAGQTWCNLALADLTRANACEVPRMIGGVYLYAHEQLAWLRGELVRNGQRPELQGPEHGWWEVSELKAREAANRGWPTVVGWVNPDPARSSHVALVMPAAQGTYIAQAGRTCFGYGSLGQGFGNLGPLLFFTHN